MMTGLSDGHTLFLFRCHASNYMSKPPPRVATGARRWCPGQDSNLRPSAPEADALSTELLGRRAKLTRVFGQAHFSTSPMPDLTLAHVSAGCPGCLPELPRASDLEPMRAGAGASD